MTDAYEMIMDVRLLCLQKQIWINAEGKKYFLSLENSFLSCSDKLQVARSSKFFLKSNYTYSHSKYYALFLLIW